MEECAYRMAASYGGPSIPSKYIFFMWLLVKNANLTWASLQKRGWEGPSIYVICKNNGYDGQHLILNYSFSTQAWLKCTLLFTLYIDMLEGSDVWAGLRLCKDNRGLVTRIVAAIYWNIWREKNNRIFKNTSHTVDGCVNRVYIDVMLLIGLLWDRRRICISENDDT